MHFLAYTHHGTLVRTTLSLIALLAANPFGSAEVASPARVRFERVYAIERGVQVFAYSRISPDGKLLTFTTETAEPGKPDEFSRTLMVVDLSSNQIVFTEQGLDGYFSVDSRRLIFLSNAERRARVSIRNNVDGALIRDVAPTGLGDYYSWGERDGQDLILTIKGAYYFLNGDRSMLPPADIPACGDIGAAHRPLLSKDGRRVSTFVQERLVVRNLDDCGGVILTGLEGAKADFSFDGRFLAFHTPRKSGTGYDVAVADLERRTVRTITESLSGSSFFPSWTKDGRLSFRYEGEDYNGFMFALDVFSHPEYPFPTVTGHSAPRNWEAVFPETPRPASRTTIVLVWGAWSAHVPEALRDLVALAELADIQDADLTVLSAATPTGHEPWLLTSTARYGARLARIPLLPQSVIPTGLHAQNPTTLLFRDGLLVDRRLGAQSYDELCGMVRAVLNACEADRNP